MARNTACTIFIGNLDEKVTERVLYEILIQAGYLVDLHLPRDKESNNHKGYAFAEYETEEVANYAVKLFSGLVRLYNKTLRFAMAGQDKSSSNSASPAANKPNSSSMRRPRPVGAFCGNYSEESLPSSIIHKDAVEKHSIEPAFHHSASGNLVAKELSNGNFEYSRRVIGSMINGAARAGAHNPITYTSY
ncbi:protein HSH49 isoform X1 [Dendrobium catenatum]|uniref:Splicing factor U2af large subunit A n=1 Tax=Dendrobium catenatum TaxID=906689 RepID=A0A2I0X2P1_9ASPA|nr:protein HSH49 isoform X1 [Dendrobium catenatum]PKU82184.1 Splicing factor U2af large subunit A [Dendrobium catenatum]